MGSGPGRTDARGANFARIGWGCSGLRLVVALALFLPLAWTLRAHAHDAPETPRCFDAAVVARLVRETPGPTPDRGLDVFVMRWPWVLEFETEEVVIGRVGRGRLSVTAHMHINFNRRIDHFLLFLRRDSDGAYVAEDIVVNVVRDRRNRFVVPFDGPVAPDGLWPRGWVPEKYQSYLRPVHYRRRDAWWLSDGYVDRDYPAETQSGWHEWRDGRAVALRGLYMSDLPSMMAQATGAICQR